MPKIRVKNIPRRNRVRVCHKAYSCTECPFYKNADTACLVDYEHDPTIIELSEKDFPTNREWLESLSNEDLAKFMTTGLIIRDGKNCGCKAIGRLITDKEDMLDWLSQPCAYLMEEEQ